MITDFSFIFYLSVTLKDNPQFDYKYFRTLTLIFLSIGLLYFYLQVNGLAPS